MEASESNLSLIDEFDVINNHEQDSTPEPGLHDNVENDKNDVSDVDENTDDDDENEVEEKDSSEMDEETKTKLRKVIYDFMNDILNTFPEYRDTLEVFSDLEDDAVFEKVIAFCKKSYLPQFFNIMYENEEIFESSFYCLPGVRFNDLYMSNISDTTKNILWKYLQLILFTCIGNIDNNDFFGDTTKLFEAIDSSQLYEKIMETVEDLQKTFDGTQQASSSDGPHEGGNYSGDVEDDDNSDDEDRSESNSKTPFNMDDMKNMFDPEKLNEHLSSIMDGKIGSLAKEIASDAVDDLKDEGIDVEDPKKLMNDMFKNPTKIMGLVKKIGSKIDGKIKDGSIKESELVEEAKDIMDKFQDIPGLKNMMNSMGMGGGKGGKMDMKGMMNRMQTHMRQSQQKERMLEKLKKKREMEEKMKKEHELKMAEMREGVTIEKSSSDENTFVFTANDDTKVKRSKAKKASNKKKGKKKNKK